MLQFRCCCHADAIHAQQAPRSSRHFLSAKSGKNGPQIRYFGQGPAFDLPKMEAFCEFDNMKVQPQKQIATC